MNQTRFLKTGIYVLAGIVVALANFLFVTRVSGISYAAYRWQNFADAYSMQLNYLYIYVNETYLYGSVQSSGNTQVTVTLNRAGAVVSQVTTTTDYSGYFDIYFNSPILAGDVIQVFLPATPAITVNVPLMSISIDKNTNVFSVKAPPNSYVYPYLFSYSKWQWYYFSGVTDASGNYSFDTSSQVDVFLGDGAQLYYYSPGNYNFLLRNYRTPGILVSAAGDYVSGYAVPGAAVSLTLKNSTGAVKATASVSADNGSYFSTQFTNPALVDIVVGDRVEMSYPGGASESITVANAVITSIDPSTNLVSGTAPPLSKLLVSVNDPYQGSDAKKVVTADSSGRFTADFNTLAAPVRPFSAPDPSRAPGNQTDGQLSGSQKPQSMPKDGSPANGNEVPQQPGMGMPLPGMNPDGVPLPEPDPRKAVNQQAPLALPFDILPGSYASVTLHDPLDNESLGNTLYAGPYIKAYINSYDDMLVVGQPGEHISATLSNALGAIKGSASLNLGNEGASYFSFYDTANNYVPLATFDTVRVTYSNGSIRSLNLIPINYVIDRDANQVYGTGPANTTLRLNFNYGDYVYDVTTDAAGAFSQHFGWLCGGYNFKVYYRSPQGDDLIYDSTVPQFTVYPERRYLYGYGPVNASLVAGLVHGGSTIETRTATSSSNGYYWINFQNPIQIGDTITVDFPPLHFSQQIVGLSIAADPLNNVVYGSVPSNAWLNIFDQTNFGPYSNYNYRYFYASSSGNYAAAFSEVRAGDDLEVLYWQNGDQDRVSIQRTAPYVQIDQAADVISGADAPGSSGTVTIRNSQDVIKSSGEVYASYPYGNFSYHSGADIVPGDTVQVSIGALQRTEPVIPLAGALNVNTNVVSGTSLPNTRIGTDVWLWQAAWGGYSYWVPATGTSTRRFVQTDSSGNFSLDFSPIADLTLGDYTSLYFISPDDTRYAATYYTTHPTLAVTQYPATVQPGSIVSVEATLANGAHSQSIYLNWDTVTHANGSGYYRFGTNWMQGSIGPNLLSFVAPSGGAIYFTVYATVDGQSIRDSQEHMIVVNSTKATTLIDPVSGTTNDNTPEIKGVSAPNASVALYTDSGLVQTVTANDLGNFSFQFVSSLAPGIYNFHAISTVGGVPGDMSNIVHLTVNPALLVDPVHILLTTLAGTQHLRDNNGYANLGGRVWTRTGETVQVAIPISGVPVDTAELFVGGVKAATLINNGSQVYVGSYMPPTSGNYQLDLKITSGGILLPTINILTGLIDPDGYVYDSALGLNNRIAGATVTCYEQVSGGWEIWNGALWSQQNPQVVGSDGYYEFFTLPGTYKITVSAPGYFDYESSPFAVVADPIHLNIPLVKHAAPALDPISAKTGNELSLITFTAKATAAGSLSVTYTLDAASTARGMSIGSTSGDFSWTPTEAQGPGSYQVSVTATDNGVPALHDTRTFTLTVLEVNSAPGLGVVGNKTVTQTQNLTFTVTATDTDLPLNQLAFSLDAASLAKGMLIDSSTGVFSWTPSKTQAPGDYQVTITVTDNGNPQLSASTTITITVKTQKFLVHLPQVVR